MPKEEREIYKDIKGYEGMYQISNMGNVRSLDRIVGSKANLKIFIKGKVLKPTHDGDGYPFVNLCKENKKKNMKNHRLLALYFMPNPNNLPCVDHIDGDKTNNNIKNLRWCTHLQNTWNKKGRKGRLYKGVIKRGTERFGAQIKCKGINYLLGKFDTAEEAAQAYNDMAIKLNGEFAGLNVIPSLKTN